MKHFLFISLAITSGLVSKTNAGTMSDTQSHNWAWVSSISAGPTWANHGGSQTFYLTPEIEKTYTSDKNSRVLGVGELFIGIQKSLSTQWLSQFGFAIAASGNAKPQGVIWDDANPEFANLTYQYKIQTTHVAVKGKLLLDKGYWLMPFASASLGVGFNRAHDFENTPLIFEALPNNNFSSHTNTAFTYTLSAGVQKALNEHWQAGLEYEFADWGKSSLGHALEQTLNSGITHNHLYTNGIMLNLTYVI